MSVTIDNVRYGNDLLPLVAEIYDMDGFKGLYVPDNITNVRKRMLHLELCRELMSNPVLQQAISTAISATNKAIKRFTEKKIRK
jgi:hypothetical protein